MSAITEFVDKDPALKRKYNAVGSRMEGPRQGSGRKAALPTGEPDGQSVRAPCHEASEPSGMVNRVFSWFSRYIRTQRPVDLDYITLWAVHTHLLSFLPVSPRMIIDSIMPGSGKITLLEHLAHICHLPLIASGISSPALIPRMIAATGERSITVLIDEADRALDPKKEGVGDLLAVINSGSKRGATRPVLVPDKDLGWKAQNMPTYCAVAMAGNSPMLLDDTRSRSSQVFLLPDNEGRAVETDWVTDTSMEDAARCLCEGLEAWADLYGERVRRPAGHCPRDARAGLRSVGSPSPR